jgi:hypothetical protein
VEAVGEVDFTDLLKLDYRWPEEGDRLLRDSGSWDDSVRFEDHAPSRDAHIASGFMEAGAALLDLCAKEPHARHTLVYPALFNYRHGLELAMKSVISRYASYANVEVPNTNHHDLLRLWEVTKQIIVAVGSEDPALPMVEQVVKDFHDLDRGSDAFRYARDRRGALIPLPDGAIDLRNLRDVMEGVEHFFEGADAQMNENASNAGDW